MNLGKKVFLLSLLLLLLIVTCVYKHTKEFMNEVSITQEQVANKEEKVQASEIKQSQKEAESEQVTSENNEKHEANLDESIQSNNETTNDKITKFEEQNQQIEEIKQPNLIILKRKDEGYRRSNGEFFYYELSPKSKEIQDKLYTIMKNEPFIFGKDDGIDYLKINDDLLNKIIKIMQDNPNLKFEIAGHASIRPDDDRYNKYISVMRAANIKKELIARGISKRRMKARGYGDKIPLIQDQIKLFNRIEFNIIGE
ncbi:hypothetical protein CRV00_10075 [Malaciobacter molluscorum]|uniref:OmpA family protein n=1 Tax=Malaciobacter molluscorum TaxID=1032072 RepID=UPI00100A6B14|nr:OmpA family protein [Malaciobacter molluscorum]RXJ93593.1 hypothetical protein CRV00_10075 [Malaciobacter molluscorum]